MNVHHMPHAVTQAVFDGMEAHLRDALRRLREHAEELDIARQHNETLVALLLQRDRQLARIRADLLQVRGVLGEDLR